MNSKTLLIIIIALVALGILIYLYKSGKFTKGPIHGQYEQKVAIEKNRKIIYPEFTVTFKGQTKASQNPDNSEPHLIYNFEISSGDKTIQLAIDTNIGFTGTTQLKYFNFNDKKFYLVADSTTHEMFINYQK